MAVMNPCESGKFSIWKKFQSLTENLSFVVSFDPEPLARMEGAQALTKSPVDFVVGEKFL
jgi:hypothetical protein